MPAVMMPMARNWVGAGISPRTIMPVRAVAIGTQGMNSDAICGPNCLTA